MLKVRLMIAAAVALLKIDRSRLPPSLSPGTLLDGRPQPLAHRNALAAESITDVE